MDKFYWSLLVKIAAYMVLLPTFIVLVKWSTRNRMQKKIGLFVFVSLFVEVVAHIVGRVLILSNLPILHIFTIIEFGLIAYIFGTDLKSYLSEKKIYWLIGLFSLFSILNSVFHESIYQFNAFARAVESLLIILLALLYFYSILKNMTEKHLESSPMFWFSTGVLFYFSSSLFIFIYSNILFGETKNSFTIWGLHAIMSIVLYIFYTIALWVKPKT